MNRRRRIVVAALLVLLIATVVGLVLTSRPIVEPRSRSSFRRDPFVRLVSTAQDQFETARKLAETASTRQERRLAREALRIADNQVDLAFAIALQEAAENPPQLSPEARAVFDRLKNAQAKVDLAGEEIERLKAQLAAAKPEAKDGLLQELQVVEARAALEQNEVDEARHDLRRAGGDPQGILQRMKQRYEAQEQAFGGLQNIVPSGAQDSAEETQSGSIVALARAWYSLHGKTLQLQQAEQGALAQITELKSSREKPDQERARRIAGEPTPSVSGPSAARPGGETASSAAKPGTAAPTPPRKRADQSQVLELIDKRVEDETQLADTYKKWSTFVRDQRRQCVHQLLFGLLWILVIAFVATIIDIWVSRSLARMAADRKQVHTLHSVTGYAIRGGGAILILLVVFGAPSQFAAVLALAGAGLTVALKDFIVAFIGWFVLMGRNGIRVGDWVEVNGVSGEVLEIGPLRTILLETGNWSDAGHPTGRQVAFMNGYAVEGNYFNFSTSGQWMWDEIQFAVPTDSDPFAMAEAVKELVAAETQKNAQLAADEWRKVAPRSAPEVFRGEPVMSVRPTGSGATLVIRYITRANDRHVVRSRIDRAMLDLQRRKGRPQAEPGAEVG